MSVEGRHLARGGPRESHLSDAARRPASLNGEVFQAHRHFIRCRERGSRPDSLTGRHR
jgi:hypothetical protein